MTDQYKITADQLRSFIERYETLEAEKEAILQVYLSALDMD